MSQCHVCVHQDHSWTWQRQDTGFNLTSRVPDQGERLQLVVITFSNKAARELQDRLAVLLGQTVASRVIAGQIPLLVQQHPVHAELKQIIIALHRFHMKVLRMPELLLGHAGSLAKQKAQVQLPCP